MTALELYELVKPLIGTEWAPSSLHFILYDDGTVQWAHATASTPTVVLPVPAALAMWEASIMDEKEGTSITKMGNEWVVCDNFDDNYPVFHGPTRLHALVRAAGAVSGNDR